jgi:hypothetical protein
MVIPGMVPTMVTNSANIGFPIRDDSSLRQPVGLEIWHNSECFSKLEGYCGMISVAGEVVMEYCVGSLRAMVYHNRYARIVQ